MPLLSLRASCRLRVAREGLNCLPRFCARSQKDAQFKEVCSRQRSVGPTID